ncbi:golgin Putative 4 [Actinidia rufa]|uniref:Golgin Putative 4 n=1 Tax=Actinidia rufa TaxID=165716 RepID=A0A7J0EC44_9ERIC|nr:golgin Putative 4 [Actinidia rufa]
MARLGGNELIKSRQGQSTASYMSNILWTPMPIHLVTTENADEFYQGEISRKEKEDILEKLSQADRMPAEGRNRVNKLEEDNAKLRHALEQNMSRINRMSVDSDFFVDRFEFDYFLRSLKLSGVTIHIWSQKDGLRFSHDDAHKSLTLKDVLSGVSVHALHFTGLPLTSTCNSHTTAKLCPHLLPPYSQLLLGTSQWLWYHSSNKETQVQMTSIWQANCNQVVLVTYFQRNHSKEGLDLMVRMLGFSDEDKQRIGGARQGTGKGVVRGVLGLPGWLVGGILGGGSTEANGNMASENQVSFLLQ